MPFIVLLPKIAKNIAVSRERVSTRKKRGGSVTRLYATVVCCSDGNKLQGLGNKMHRPAQS